MNGIGHPDIARNRYRKSEKPTYPASGGCKSCDQPKNFLSPSLSFLPSLPPPSPAPLFFSVSLSLTSPHKIQIFTNKSARRQRQTAVQSLCLPPLSTLSPFHLLFPYLSHSPSHSLPSALPLSPLTLIITPSPISISILLHLPSLLLFSPSRFPPPHSPPLPSIRFSLLFPSISFYFYSSPPPYSLPFLYLQPLSLYTFFLFPLPLSPSPPPRFPSSFFALSLYPFLFPSRFLPNTFLYPIPLSYPYLSLLLPTFPLSLSSWRTARAHERSH